VAMRLLGRKEEQEALSEKDCYAHSYGQHLLDRVDPVRLEPAAPARRLVSNVETIRHVSSEGLKQQFLERLEARKSRPRKGEAEARRNDA
jgi:hypothetical protein